MWLHFPQQHTWMKKSGRLHSRQSDQNAEKSRPAVLRELQE